MSDDETPQMPLDPVNRRALVVWYDDETNTVSLDGCEFTWLEVPELLKAALDIAEENLPTSRDHADDTEEY